jgi:hypothetical protein
MSSSLIAILILAGAPKLDCGEMWCELYATPKDAFASILAKTKPRIISVGEVHQTNTSTGVRSAISRFTKEMLPALTHKASDLIAETWVSSGDCGVEETEAVEEIEEVTQRPVETEDEVVTLLKSARAINILPHILEVSCDEYRAMLDKEGELDSEKVLNLVTKLLAEKAKFLHAKNESRKSKRIVVIYGGAIHNDLHPEEDYASFSYGKELDAASEERYLAVDLFVPELIDTDEEWKKEAWYPHFAKHTSKTKTLVIQEDSSSFIVVFPRTPARRR